MPGPRPVIIVGVIAFAAIFVLFPGYNSLQTAPLIDEFRGELGDETLRASAAAVADVVFACCYALLGVIVAPYVTSGILRVAASIVSVVAGLADVAENITLLFNIRAGEAVTQDRLDLMHTFGSVKWGAASIAVVMLLALAGQQWLERRRGY